jgi:hypothetical protein
MSFISDSLARKAEQNPQMDYMWRVQMPSIDTITDSSGGNDLRAYINRNKKQTSNQSSSTISAEDISFRVFQIDTPYTSFTPRKSIHGLSYRYAADHNDIGSLTVLIDEMEDGMTLAYLMAWHDLIKNSDGSRNPPGMYKKQIKLVRLSQSATDIHFSDYIGYFPTDIQPTQYNYDGSGVLQYSVTFTGDDVLHQRVETETAIASVENELLRANYRTRNVGLSPTQATERNEARRKSPLGYVLDAASSYFGL